MNNLKAELSYFRQKIGADYGAELSESRPLPAGAIKSTVEQSPFAGTLSFDDLTEIIRNLEASFSSETQTAWRSKLTTIWPKSGGSNHQILICINKMGGDSCRC